MDPVELSYIYLLCPCTYIWIYWFLFCLCIKNYNFNSLFNKAINNKCKWRITYYFNGISLKSLCLKAGCCRRKIFLNNLNYNSAFHVNLESKKSIKCISAAYLPAQAVKGNEFNGGLLYRLATCRFLVHQVTQDCIVPILIQTNAKYG